MLGVYNQAFILFFFFKIWQSLKHFVTLVNQLVPLIRKGWIDLWYVYLGIYMLNVLGLLHTSNKRSFVQQALGIVSYELLYQKLTINLIESKHTYHHSTFIFQLNFIRTAFVSTNLKLFKSISFLLLPFHTYVLLKVLPYF